MKQIISGFLALALAVCLSAAAFAASNTPSALTASVTASGVAVSGAFEDGSGVVAAAVELLGSAGIVAFKTLAVTDNAFSDTLPVSLAAGATYTLRAADYKGGAWKTVTFTVPSAAAPSGAVYTLRFETNGGSALTALTKAAGSGIALSGYVPLRAGYTFSGWYSDEALTTAVTEITLARSMTVYAGWIWNNPFADVPEGSYYRDAVRWAFEKGVTQGKTAALFAPDGVCTLAQAVTFLWRAAGSPAPTGKASAFTDVDAGAYYYKAVLWAVEAGVTKGTGSTTFSPEKVCTRAEIVTFLWRAAGSPAATAANPFTDVHAGAYYGNAVLWAVAQKITQGTTAATFSPAQTCTRAQIVAFLWRQFGK